MKFKIVSRSPDLSSDFPERARRRLRSVLGFAPWIRGGTVRFSDDNGPRGGVDKRVTIELQCHGRAPLVFAARAESYELGLSRVLKRARQSILRSPLMGSRRPVRGARLEPEPLA